MDMTPLTVFRIICGCSKSVSQRRLEENDGVISQTGRCSLDFNHTSMHVHALDLHFAVT